jgi:hypothetical protein
MPGGRSIQEDPAGRTAPGPRFVFLRVINFRFEIIKTLFVPGST